MTVLRKSQHPDAAATRDSLDLRKILGCFRCRSVQDGLALGARPGRLHHVDDDRHGDGQKHRHVPWAEWSVISAQTQIRAARSWICVACAGSSPCTAAIIALPGRIPGSRNPIPRAPWHIGKCKIAPAGSP
jgi:hypothetical protein